MVRNCKALDVARNQWIESSEGTEQLGQDYASEEEEEEEEEKGGQPDGEKLQSQLVQNITPNQE